MGVFNSKTIFQAAAKSDIIKLIVSISIIYVVLHFIKISILIGGEDDSFFTTAIFNRLSLPLNFQEFIKRPWSLFTFMFVDLSIMRIVGNMIWLWIFGMVIEDLLGKNKIIPIYIIGGILSGIFMLIASLFMPKLGIQYVGASPSIIAIAVAAMLYRPKYEYFMMERWHVPIWVFGIIFFALQIFAFGQYNLILVGLIVGAILGGVGFNYGLTPIYEGFSNFLNHSSAYFWNNDNFVVKNKARKYPMYKTNLGKVININQKKLDILLDKINEKGIDSLTSEERTQLEQFSKQS